MRMVMKVNPAVVLTALIIAIVLAAGAMADKHRHFGKYQFNRGDHGNEATGEAAAWILGIANFPVLLSQLLKTADKVVPLKPASRDSLTTFNRLQRHHLMKLHYWLNPVAIVIAVSHWMLSHCRSTGLPEWGLGIMIAVGALGLVMKLKLAPVSMRKLVYRLHTNPISIPAVLLILLIGHSIVD